MATPFVQGRLRNRYLAATVETSCCHCDRTLRFSLNSEMGFGDITPNTDPLVFMPQVDWENFNEPSIIDAF